MRHDDIRRKYEDEAKAKFSDNDLEFCLSFIEDLMVVKCSLKYVLEVHFGDLDDDFGVYDEVKEFCYNVFDREINRRQGKLVIA